MKINATTRTRNIILPSMLEEQAKSSSMYVSDHGTKHGEYDTSNGIDTSPT